MNKNFSSTLWVYGRHAVESVLKNPNRQIIKILSTQPIPKGSYEIQKVSNKELDTLLPSTVHQGIAALVKPLKQPNLDLFLNNTTDSCLLVILDQVSDPQNIGAILRSSLAFGAKAVIMPEAGSPPETGTIIKASCGAFEKIPCIKVPNLARCLDFLKEKGFWCIGLEGKASLDISKNKLPKKCAFVFGAEDGMRRLTAQNCDMLVSLPILPDMESLNVSNAVAISLYEWTKQQGLK